MSSVCVDLLKDGDSSSSGPQQCVCVCVCDILSCFVVASYLRLIKRYNIYH